MTAQLKMIISVELVGVDGVRQRREIANVKRSVDEARLDDFGLSLEEAKEIQLHLQKELTQFQTDQAAQRDRKCPHCNCSRQVHDYRSRTIHSLFGLCRVRATVATLRMRIERKIGHRLRPDPVEWKSNAGIGANSGRTRLPFVLSRSSSCT